MSYLTQLSERYFQLVKLPITSESYSGNELRYSAEFEALEAELSKENMLHDTRPVDWEWMREKSEAFISGQSKDLRVLVWLAWSLFQSESYSGLQAGLSMLRYLCSNHWDEVYPEKNRTRAAAFNWLCARLEQLPFEQVAIGEQRPLFKQLIEHLQAIEEILSARLGDEAPLLLPLCRRLDEMLVQASAGQPTPGPLSSALAQVKQAAEQVFSPAATLENEKGAQKSLRALQDQARPLCAFWLKQKASDLRALRLTRTLSWLAIDTLPEHNSEGIIPLRGISPDMLASLREQFQQQRYADVLIELETTASRAPFWLDGQRLIWECLHALQAEMAMREVEIQLALFLQRLAGLEALRFHDGVPLADCETRLWLSAHVLPHLRRPDTDNQPAMPTSEGNAPAWELALQDAQSTLQTSGLKPAVQQLKKAMSNIGAGGRERFLWQLTLARLCFTAKKYELARTQLEALDRVLKDAGVDQWEPGLVLDVLNLAHACCELLPQNQAVREHKEEIHRRLCHLDVEAVLD